MADEQDLIAQFIYTRLSADTVGAGSLESLFTGITGRIYNKLADQSENTYPIIVFNMQACLGPLLSIGSKRHWVRFRYQLKVQGKNQAESQLSPVMSRVDVLFDLNKLTTVLPVTVTGGTIRESYYWTDIPLPTEEKDGIVYPQLSKEYLITAQAA